jgi:hypothetical protein
LKFFFAGLVFQLITAPIHLTAHFFIPPLTLFVLPAILFLLAAVTHPPRTS